MVGAQGFEPWTFCSQSRRASQTALCPVKTLSCNITVKNGKSSSLFSFLRMISSVFAAALPLFPEPEEGRYENLCGSFFHGQKCGNQGEGVEEP